MGPRRVGCRVAQRNVSCSRPEKQAFSLDAWCNPIPSCIFSARGLCRAGELCIRRSPYRRDCGPDGNGDALLPQRLPPDARLQSGLRGGDAMPVDDAATDPSRYVVRRSRCRRHGAPRHGRDGLAGRLAAGRAAKTPQNLTEGAIGPRRPGVAPRSRGQGGIAASVLSFCQVQHAHLVLSPCGGGCRRFVPSCRRCTRRCG